MTRLALLRHAPTDWNAKGLLQGRTDVPLSLSSRERLPVCRLPTCLDAAVWHASPLVRAAETATLLGGVAVRLQPRLTEMDFGRFEGRRLADLRAELGDEMARNEARGLDFKPPGGESPREVQARLRPWLADCAAAGGDHVAVCHKAVIRAVLALAFDWDMTGKPPVKLDWTCLHIFELGADGGPRVLQLNLALEQR
ncbi:MAG: histidine phosphatase family protein [Alphaproteobacteria bacterium]|jgi:probable phosphoglycerate mutase|nr:histidine phosphatase family protein [Alphaproteobacteria bacterium]